jgi:cytochrome P450
LNGDRAGELPAGPPAPTAVQTLQWWFRPIPFMENCRKRFGPVFSLRLGPGRPIVMIGEPHLAKAVITGDPDIFHAGDTNGLFKPLVGSHSILLLDGEEHLRHRRMLLPAFGASHGRRFADQVREIAERRIAAWKPGQRLRLLDEMEEISFDSIMRVVFGGDPDGEHQSLRSLIPEMMDRCDSPFALIPWFHRRVGGLSPWARVLRVLAEIDSALYKAIAQRRADPLSEFRDDVLSVLVRTRYEDGSPLDDREIRDELLTLMMAGYETTTAALAWSLERLMRSEGGMERLEREVKAGKDDYLDAVVKETLRVRPVVPVVARRLMESRSIEGHIFSAGTILMVSVYLVHNDSSSYGDPQEFRPERFLPESSRDLPWIPFGGGTRRCLGASFAQLEMKVVLSEIASRVKLRAVGRRSEPQKRRRFTFSPGSGAEAEVVELRSAPRPLGDRRFRVPEPDPGSVRSPK